MTGRLVATANDCRVKSKGKARMPRAHERERTGHGMRNFNESDRWVLVVARCGRRLNKMQSLATKDERIIPDGAHMQIVYVPLNEERQALVRDADGTTATWLVEMRGSAQRRVKKSQQTVFHAARSSVSASPTAKRPARRRAD